MWLNTVIDTFFVIWFLFCAWLKKNRCTDYTRSSSTPRSRTWGWWSMLSSPTSSQPSIGGHIFVKMNISTESLWQAGHGDDEDVQHREGDCVQHLPMLPQEGSQDHHPGSWTGQPPCLDIFALDICLSKKYLDYWKHHSCRLNVKTSTLEQS